jgi:hypothetical protein
METKFKRIETKDYILAVSDEEIKKENCYLYNKLSKSIRKCFSIEKNRLVYTEKDIVVLAYKSKNNAPELELPLLPEEECCEGDGSNCNGSCCVVEDDVDKLAEKIVENDKNDASILWIKKFYFKKGYKTATKKYSEEDLRKAIDKGYELARMNLYKADNTLQPKIEEFIQSLKQPKTPTHFLAEIEDGFINELGDFSISMNSLQGEVKRIKRLKTKVVDGKTYLSGTYL